MSPFNQLIYLARDKLSQLIGVYYHDDHLSDFFKASENLSRDFGYENVEKWFQKLLTTPFSKNEIMQIAKFYTIGESYFFREPRMFEELSRNVLPRLIQTNGDSNKIIKIWCAGCGSGEEAYTLSFVLNKEAKKHEFLYQILATDIQGESLENAKKGIFGKWSFRGVLDNIKQEYFDGYKKAYWKVKEEFRNYLEFYYFNLAKDIFPSILNKTTDVDIIFCRNVLMYFSQELQQEVLWNFFECLKPGGYLFLSVTEISTFTQTPFQMVSEGGIHFYRKPTIFENKEIKISQPKIGEVKKESLQKPPLSTKTIESPQKMADNGNLIRASVKNLYQIKEDTMNPKYYYLQGMIFFEQEKPKDSIEYLKKCLYLQPDHILTHFFLGLSYQKLNQIKKSQQYFQQVILLLDKLPSDEVVPDSDQLSAERLKVMVQSMIKEGAGTQHV